ncbi:hypothetical protein HS088_TW04G00014 [Tripterygium wilfordii]|uniref:Uncharacterized protein n=1 Tax=Tripterygium wilfordii TaxID=458696 RepID=A0A7J7DPQ3_TRIWF|nr:hypothetical protein HS088_TW04G00014 [Tripterygium wilfordii]
MTVQVEYGRVMEGLPWPTPLIKVPRRKIGARLWDSMRQRLLETPQLTAPILDSCGAEPHPFPLNSSDQA